MIFLFEDNIIIYIFFQNYCKINYLKIIVLKVVSLFNGVYKDDNYQKNWAFITEAQFFKFNSNPQTTIYCRLIGV